MTAIVFSRYAQALCNRREITASNALSLRRQLTSDSGISQEEAEMLFTLDMECPTVSAEWKALFVEALTEYVVNHPAPRGFVDDVKARWLMAHIGADDRPVTEADMELLQKILETAEYLPGSLYDFATNLRPRPAESTPSAVSAPLTQAARSAA